MPKLTEEQTQMIFELAKGPEEYSVNKIAEEVGCGHTTVQYYLDPELREHMRDYLREYRRKSKIKTRLEAKKEERRKRYEDKWRTREFNYPNYVLTESGKRVLNNGKIVGQEISANTMNILILLDEEPKNECDILDIFREEEIYEKDGSRDLQIYSLSKSMQRLRKIGLIK